MGQGAAVDFWVGVLRQGFPHLAYLKYEGGAKLKDIGHPAVRKLIALFEGNDRTVAIDVISAIGEPAVPDLLTALSDEHLQTQMGAMEALARIKT
ncbi:MAG: HEAT repeat domain-containing protein [Nitrospirales bacterium]|nr:HEAT repeat domain-containing protein [Nitrospirales bacterium]